MVAAAGQHLRLLAAAALISLAVAASAAPPSKGKPAPVRNVTQAGCACLALWRDAKGAPRSNCANPNKDPKGAWCAVDAAKCLGYYGTHYGRNGSQIYYDYCGSVRERTARGCLCEPEWKVNGVGKASYRDRCAHPNNETVRTCRVDRATCPPGADVTDFDTCAQAAAQPQQQGVEQPLGPRSSTFHNCSCIVGGWWYLYPSGAAAAGPVNRTIKGCANPDGDPLGPWCAVDPEKCDRFAGFVGVDPVNRWAFDYCEAEAPVLKLHSKAEKPSCPRWSVSEWGQCGGKSNCTETGCADGQWPGVCCRKGLRCRRQDGYYWQCVNPRTTTGTEPPGGANRALIGKNPKVLPDAEALAEFYATLRSMRPKEEGPTVQVSLRINYPYELVVGSPGTEARLKADMVEWLKASVASASDAKYILGAGVDDIANGSVVVHAHVKFTADTPPEVVQAVSERLQHEAADLYKLSDLHNSWGPLMIMDGGGGAPSSKSKFLDVVSRSALPPTVPRRVPGADGGRLQLGVPEYAGIACGCACIMGLLGFVVQSAISRNRGVDRDKDAQLAYMNELTEEDLDEWAAEAAAEAAEAAGGGPGSAVVVGYGRLWTWMGGVLTPLGAVEGGEEATLDIVEEEGEEESLGASSDYHTSIAGALEPSAMAATSPRSHAGITRGPMSVTAEPDSAFLQVPDGESAARRSSGGGIAFASLKQRRVSSSAGGAGPAQPVARTQGASGSGAGFGAALGRLGSAVAGFMSGGGAEPGPMKEQ